MGHRAPIQWLLLALMAGCASGVRRADLVCSSNEPPARRSFRQDEDLYLVLAPLGGQAGLGAVLVESGPTPRRWLVGGARVEVGDRAYPHVAGPLITGRVEAVLPRGEGWRFVTGDAVLDADRFLGPLTQQDLEGRGRPGRGSGRVVRVLDGRLVGALPPGDAPVLDAAFADDLRGVAVVEPGAAFRTEDGGAHWRPVGGGPYAGAVATLQGRWLLERERCAQVLADGRAALVGCTSLPTFVPSRDPLHGFIRLDGLSNPEGGPFRIAAARRTGSDVMLLLRGEVSWDEGIEVGHPPYPEGFDDRRRFTAPCHRPRYVLANRPFAVCEVRELERGNLHFELLEGTSQGVWRPALRFRTESVRGEPCAVREDGRAYVCRGRCDAAVGEDDGATFCSRCGEPPPTELRLGGHADDLAFAGWRDDGPVFTRRTFGLSDARVLDGRGHEGPLFTSMTPPSVPGMRVVRSPEIGRDGRMRLLARTQEGEPVGVWEGVPGGPFSARTLPPWWDRAAPPAGPRELLVCGHDGVLLAASSEDGLWVSDRADAPWRALFAEGDATIAAWLRHRRWDLTRLGCDEIGVELPGVGRTLGWGRVRAPLLGAANLPPPDEHEARPAPPSFAWRCDAGDEATVPPSAFVAGIPDDERTWLPGIDGFSELEASVRPTGAARLWTWADATVERPLGSPHPLPWMALPTPQEPLGFVALTRQDARGVSFLTLTQRGERVALQLFEHRGAGPVRARWRMDVQGSLGSQDHRTWGDIDGIPIDLVGLGAFGRVVAAWDHDRAAAVVTLPFWGRGRSWRVLLLTQTHEGAVRARAFEYSRALPTGVFVLPGAQGVVRLLEDGSLVGDDLTGARRVLATAIRWDPCGADARGTVVLPTGVQMPWWWDGGNDLAGVRVEFGLEGPTLCLRRLATKRLIHDLSATPERRSIGYVLSRRRWEWLRCAPR